MEDKALRKLVEEELDFEPSVEAALIGVTVENGIVHLSGKVTSYAQKIAAEAAVKRVKGVRGFTEALEVHPFPLALSDESIAAKVANLIEWDATMPKGAVKVEVDRGWVTLTGEVDWAYQGQSAEQAVRRLPGVKGVTNRVAVKPHARATDIKQRIEDALHRQAALEAHNIQVVVEGGKVMLEGKVRTWSERESVERAAWAAPGVQAVEDLLTVGD